MSELLFKSKFWPTPKTPPTVDVELTLTTGDDAPMEYRFHITLQGAGQVQTGCSGNLPDCKSHEHAKLKAMYALVNFLAEELANTIDRLPKP